jgi:hypothetical protein
MLLAAAFLLGVAVCALALAPVLFPARTYEAWCALRYGGAVPGAQGLLLTIAEAPAELRGEGPGPWVLCTLTNTQRRPLRVAYPERPGEELSFETAEPGEPAVWREGSDALPIHVTLLPPGGRIAFSCELTRWLSLHPGRHTIRAGRVPFGLRKGLPCRSNWLQLEVR